MYDDVEALIEAIIGQDEEVVEKTAESEERTAEVSESSDLIAEIDQALDSDSQVGVSPEPFKTALAQLFAAADILADGRL